MQIISTLQAAGLRAFPPAAHEGLCLWPYCVVQPLSGTLLSPRGGFVRYRVHMYVPAQSPDRLDGFALAVREAMRPCLEEGWLSLAQPCSTHSVSDAYRAVYSYIDYVSYYSEM